MIQKSSISDVNYGSRWWQRPGNAGDPLIDLYGTDSVNKVQPGGPAPGMLYVENGRTDYTHLVEHHGGANVFIRRSSFKKSLQPSLCPKAHCPKGFQYSIG